MQARFPHFAPAAGRTLTLALMLAMTTGLPTLSLSAQAAEASTALDLQSVEQSLDQALTRLADQANVRLIFNSADVANLRAPALKGRYTLSQATDEVHAMGRFVKKHGDSLYMCYVETHDWPGLRARLLEAGARYTPRGADPATDPDGGWVHPKELHGLLLGISRTGLAWEWSGRDELVPAA